MKSRGARLRERLNTIIEEAGLRGYFPFEGLIQAVAVTCRAAPGVMHLAEARKHVVQALDQEAAAVGLGANFQQGLPFFELQWQAGGHLKRKRPRRFDAGSHPQLAVNQRVALLK